jgi:NADH-quinone oxidoreductase subunit C/D
MLRSNQKVAESENSKHDALEKEIRSKFGEAVIDVDRSYDNLVIVVAKPHARDVLAHLKNERNFDVLLDIAGVDCVELEHSRERFELEYILYATDNDHRVQIRVPVPESELSVDSVSDLWQSANWAEREAFEFFGFKFEGHPNLKRLLTHHEFDGHPLRKDYPILQGQWSTTTSDLEDDLYE